MFRVASFDLHLLILYVVLGMILLAWFSCLLCLLCLQFIPSAHSESQYIASTGMDGFAMFWKFDASSREFRCVHSREVRNG